MVKIKILTILIGEFFLQKFAPVAEVSNHLNFTIGFMKGFFAFLCIEDTDAVSVEI